MCYFSILKDDDLVEFFDLESEDDEWFCFCRYDCYYVYGCIDCFWVEKYFLVYGWG